MPSVVEAEEEFAASQRELARVERLDSVLSQTLGFLAAAQETVHRDIAPVLAATVEAWLPEVTNGRYVDVMVDPQSLGVQVRSERGEWRDATLLSHGTSEQVYLLLRMAMAEHLTRQGEICPLILDDVLVQSDDDRKEAILDVLHKLSHERQVILFTQEQEVLEWSREALTDEQHQVVVLDPSLIAP